MWSSLPGSSSLSAARRAIQTCRPSARCTSPFTCTPTATTPKDGMAPRSICRQHRPVRRRRARRTPRCASGSGPASARLRAMPGSAAASCSTTPPVAPPRHLRETPPAPAPAPAAPSRPAHRRCRNGSRSPGSTALLQAAKVAQETGSLCLGRQVRSPFKPSINMPHARHETHDRAAAQPRCRRRCSAAFRHPDRLSLLPYLWPAGNPVARLRVVVAMLFLVLAKGATRRSAGDLRPHGRCAGAEGRRSACWCCPWR